MFRIKQLEIRNFRWFISVVCTERKKSTSTQVVVCCWHRHGDVIGLGIEGMPKSSSGDQAWIDSVCRKCPPELSPPRCLWPKDCSPTESALRILAKLSPWCSYMLKALPPSSLPQLSVQFCIINTKLLGATITPTINPVHQTFASSCTWWFLCIYLSRPTPNLYFSLCSMIPIHTSVPPHPSQVCPWRL